VEKSGSFIIISSGGRGEKGAKDLESGFLSFSN